MLWQYETIKVGTSLFFNRVNLDELREILNKMGADGWELVSAFAANSGGTSYEAILIFKRPAGET